MRWYHLVAGAVAFVSVLVCGGGVVMTTLGGYQAELQLAAAPATMEPARISRADAAPEEAELEGDRAFEVGDAQLAGVDIDSLRSAVSKKPEAKSAPSPAPPPPADPAAAAPDAPEVAVRQWFPESMLWMPLVETDVVGIAHVDVRVPDQLTTWRVLGLAHTRTGHQSGQTHTFDSRLPTYVDPVIPGWLVSGDRIALPVQAVNTTSEPIAAQLRVEGAGGLTGGGLADVVLAPFGTEIRRVQLEAAGSGTATVRADLRTADGGDAAVREIPIVPAGRPVAAQRGGTLSNERTWSMTSPDTADPATQALTVRVFPGPLAVLQAEAERLASGVQPAHGAYGFALAGHLTQLADRAGVDVEPARLRRLRLVAWQRVVRLARAPDAGMAADLLGNLRLTPADPLVDGLRPRLLRVLLDGQRGDGTWARQPSAPLQTVLVQTAVAARALPEDEDGARLRAAGALERYAREITDPYTAAVALCTGLVTGEQATRLLDLVTEGTSTRPDGARTVGVPSQARNPWGVRPTRAEVLAWTALAVADRAEVTWRGDLLAELMGSYDARWGFGAGAADAVALEAVTRLLPVLDQPATVTLLVDGAPAAQAPLDPAQPRVPAVLSFQPRLRTGDLGLRVEPAVPGLAFVAQLSSWVPWTGDEAMRGVEVELVAEPLRLGRQSRLTFALSAPSGVALTVEQGLPAGATVDESLLAAQAGPLASWEVHTDRIRLTTRAFQAGEVLELTVGVRPAFAGIFQTLPLKLARPGEEVMLAPFTWRVADAAGGA